MADRITTPTGWCLDDWSDFEFRLVLGFDPITRKQRNGKSYTIAPAFSWKRGRQVIKIGRNYSIGLSTAAKAWIRAAASHLKEQWAEAPPIPEGIWLNAAIVTALPTKRRTDASNLYQGVEDALQGCRTGRFPCASNCKIHAGIIADDYWIRSHDGSDRRYAKGLSIVEITLTPHATRRGQPLLEQREMEF